MNAARRCTARSSRSGRPCQRAPIKGGSVCATHGGSAPQVKAAARDRIAALVDPAIDALQRALKHRDVHAAIRAARDLLDRAGYAAPKRVELDTPDLAELLAEIDSPEGDELHRAQEMSTEAIRAECEQEHGGSCTSIQMHALRRAAVRRAQGDVEGPPGTCRNARLEREKAQQTPGVDGDGDAYLV